MIELKLRDGEVALVDDIDSWVVSHKWYLNQTSDNGAYVRCRKLGYLHRLIMRPPKHKVVDHINGNGLDNRRENLRIVTPKYNSTNRPRNFGRKGPGSYKGVIWQRNRWRAQIKNDGKCIYIGQFKSEVLAAIAYDKKAIELWGDHALPNFPKEIHKLIGAFPIEEIE